MQFPGFLRNFSRFFPSAVSLGLDLGNFSVKLVQIKRKNIASKERFLSYSMARVLGDGSRASLVEAIKSAAAALKPEARRINISVSGPNVIVRYIILPLMQDQDLRKSLDFELERYIPFKRETAVIDYRIVTTLSNNQMVVLVVAVEERFVEERVKIVREAGFETQAVNVDVFALMEAFGASGKNPNGVTAILDIGYHSSKLAVFEADKPYFSRDIELGEREIFQMLSERMAIGQQAARDLSYNPDQQKAKVVADAVGVAISSLLSELSLSFEYCERDLEKKVGHLYLTGGGSRIKALFTALEHMEDKKTDLWDPVSNFNVISAAGTRNQNEDALLLGVGTGLAL